MTAKVFYKLNESIDLRELGACPQVDTIFGAYDQVTKHTIECVRDHELLPDDIKLPALKLYPRAKFTDIMQTSMWAMRFIGFSHNAWSILSQLAIDQYQSFTCTIHRGEEARTYQMVRIVPERTDALLDWEHCVFTYWQSHGHLERGQLSITDLHAYREHVRKLYQLELEGEERIGIRLKTLALHDNRIDTDLFKLTMPALGYYVSENFVNRVKDNELTGFAFESIGELNIKKAAVQPWPGYK